MNSMKIKIDMMLSRILNETMAIEYDASGSMMFMINNECLIDEIL